MQIKMCKSGRNLILGGLGTFLFFLFAQEWLISSAYRQLIVGLSSAYRQLIVSLSAAKLQVKYPSVFCRGFFGPISVHFRYQKIFKLTLSSMLFIDFFIANIVLKIKIAAENEVRKGEFGMVKKIMKGIDNMQVFR